MMGDNWEDLVLEIKALAEELGIEFVQAHSPGYPSFGSDLWVETNKRSIDICAMLGIENLVVHSTGGATKEQFYANNLAGYKKILEYAYGRGVNILTENTTKKNGGSSWYIYTGADGREFAKYIQEETGFPNFHVCWDTGHANCEGDQYLDIIALGDELYGLHFNDNMADGDTHLMPYYVNMDIERVMTALKVIGYDGYFTLETDGSNRAATTYNGPTLEVVSNPNTTDRHEQEAILYQVTKYILEEYDCAGCFHTELVEVEGTPATCSQTGLTACKKCSECDKFIVKQEVIPAKGHDYSAAVTEPTCMLGGFTTYTCGSCGHFYNDNQVPATGHTEVIDAAVAATCTNTGLTEGKHCSVCNEVLVAQQVVAINEENHAWGEPTVNCADGIFNVMRICTRNANHQELAEETEKQQVVTQEATCNAKGSCYYVVKFSVDWYTDPYTSVSFEMEKDPENHAGGYTSYPGKDPTCTEPGLTEGKKCNACEKTVEKQVEIPALGHTEETIPGKAATCTTTGLTEGKKCAVCGTVTVEQTEIPATKHTATKTEAVAAGCTTNGNIEYWTCGTCNKHFRDEACTTEVIAADLVIPAAHTPVHVPAKEANCYQDGNSEYWSCSVCEKFFTEEACTNETTKEAVTTPATGIHSWGEGVVETTATCATAGSMKYTCITTGCTATKTEDIAALAHKNAESAEWTTNETHHWKVCPDCQTEVEKAEHSYVDGSCECGAVKANCVIDRDASLLLEGMVSIKQYYAFTDLNGQALNNTDKEYVLANAGVEITNHKGETKTVKLTYSGKYQGYYEYYVVSEGIPAKDMDKPVTFKPFIIFNEVKYYGESKEYGVLDYVDKVLTGTSSAYTSELEATLAGLLNYGAAAQTYFNGQAGYVAPDVLMNACLQDYVDRGLLAAEALELNWSGNLITPTKTPSEAMTVNFASTGTLRDNSDSLILEGAISIKCFVGVGNDQTLFDNATSKTMYFWTEKDYAALEAAGTPLTKENASYKIESTDFGYGGKSYGYEFRVVSEQIAAKNMSDTLYTAMCITDENGKEHCTGVWVHSVESYAKRQLEDATNTRHIDELVQWMVVYGERARINFA